MSTETETPSQPRREGLARQSKYEDQMRRADRHPDLWIVIGAEFNHPQTARAWFTKQGFTQTSRKNDDGRYTLWIKKELTS